MKTLEPIGAITSPSALKEYSLAVREQCFDAYLIVQLIVSTGCYCNNLLKMTASDMQNSIKPVRKPNGQESYYFTEDPISEELYCSLFNGVTNKQLNKPYFLTNTGEILTRQMLRTIFEKAEAKNPAFHLNAVSLRKTYFWNKYISSTNRSKVKREIQCYTDEDIAAYFNVSISMINTPYEENPRETIFSTDMLKSTLSNVQVTCDQIQSTYQDARHPDRYYEALTRLLVELDTAVSKFQVNTKGI